ncbi:hypothetical protein [Patiriisocius hiemis]|uniref:Uncharacterized protein n=1 Tax=Patiriisocius hiemis TaxID=3075604 RepID=A0ABU2YAX4_9FLAO|nr:hypothetical protein [Constantimarinum sp. W242]MDT0555337.1 hypothetical protein [Constantimarinum sp. W242]
MKNLIYALILIALGLIIFNVTKLNFEALFEGDSMIAAISILASACTILLLAILLVSKKIHKKQGRN